MGNVELLQSMFDHGINKDSTNTDGRSVLPFVVESGNIEAIRYLLDIGVTLPKHPSGTHEMRCKDCGRDLLLVEAEQEGRMYDPCMVAIKENMLQVVKLLEDYGSQALKCMTALRHAMIQRSVDVVNYLLSKYTYPLNGDYATEYWPN